MRVSKRSERSINKPIVKLRIYTLIYFIFFLSCSKDETIETENVKGTGFEAFIKAEVLNHNFAFTAFHDYQNFPGELETKVFSSSGSCIGADTSQQIYIIDNVKGGNTWYWAEPKFRITVLDTNHNVLFREIVKPFKMMDVVGIGGADYTYYFAEAMETSGIYPLSKTQDYDYSYTNLLDSFLQYGSIINLAINHKNNEVAFTSANAYENEEKSNFIGTVINKKTKRVKVSDDLAKLSITYDSKERIWMLNKETGEIRILDSDLKAVKSFKNTYSLKKPESIISDQKGNIFIADTGNNRIVVLAESGALLGVYGSLGNKAGQFNYPVDIQTENNKLYVVDKLNHRVQVLYIKYF